MAAGVQSSTRALPQSTVPPSPPHGHVICAPGERERVRSVLSDLSKTGGDFRALAARGAEGIADALLPRLRSALEEVGQVGGGERGGRGAPQGGQER